MKFYISYFYKTRKFFLVFLLCCLKTAVFAQTIVLENDKEISSLGSSLSYYVEEKNQNYTIDEISNSNLDIKWKKNPSEHLNLGYNSNTVWLKVEIENKSKVEDWQLIVDVAFVDTLIFYQQNRVSETNSWKIIQTGWHFPYSTRGEIEHFGFCFPLELPTSKSDSYYFKLNSKFPILLPITITQKREVVKYTQSSHIGYGIYFGILLVMILYNLVIFFVVRDVNYFYYVLTVFFTFILFTGLSGYLFKYIYPNYPQINVFITRLAMVLLGICSSIFTIQFLELRKNYPKLFVYFIGLILLSILALIANFTFWEAAINTFLKIHTFSLLATGVYCWIKGNKFARFFVIAWTVYLIGGLLSTLRNGGSLPINFWTTHGVEIGSALEVILISMALADRYRIINKEKEIATKKALELEQKTSQELEEQVKERTIKLNESNEELSQINEELSINIETIEQQKTQIESKNKDITDSINYAKRIQDALLPSQNSIQASFGDSFTLYLPKDVVSGDFYFFIKNETHIFLAVADCTGHGVPGSLMSMIGTNLLRESILEKQLILPSEILMNLHKEIVTTLKQKETGNRDGMDITICVINKVENKIYFSGAKNTLIAIKNEEIKEYKGSKFSIGGSIKTEGIKFEDEIINIDSQTSYYMYSDGYQDQFGGEKNKKFMRKNLKNLLQSIHKLPFEEQKQILQNTIFEWQKIGNASQIDDILVMGFKI